MKNLFSLGLLLTFIFSACSDEDLSLAIIGQYELQNYEIISDCDDPEIIAQDITASNGGCIVLDGESFCLRLDFRADGTATLTESYDTEEYTEILDYQIDKDGNGRMCFDDDCTELIEISFDGNQLILDGQEDGCTTIEKYKKL